MGESAGIVDFPFQAAGRRGRRIVPRCLAEILRAAETVLLEGAEPGQSIGIAGFARIEQIAERARLLAALKMHEGQVQARSLSSPMASARWRAVASEASSPPSAARRYQRSAATGSGVTPSPRW